MTTWLQRRNRRLKNLTTHGGFDPLTVVGGWLRVANATGSGSSLIVPDIAQSGIDARPIDAAAAPTIIAGSPSTNGYPVMSFDGVANYLRWQMTDAMNQATKFGLAGWVYLDVNTGVRDFFAQMGALCGVNRMFVRAEPGSFSRLYGPPSTENFTTGIATPTGVWIFVRLTYDGTLSAANRLQFSVNGTLQTLTYTNAGGVDEIPSSLNQASAPLTGKYLGLGGGSGGGGFFDGRARDIFFLPNGHIDAATDLNLMNYETMSGAS